MTMTKKLYKLFYYLTVFIILGACNPTRYLTQNEKLFNAAKVYVQQDSFPKDRKEAFEAHLQELIRPKPNKKILGIRYKLWFWNMGGGPDSTNSAIKKWLKRRGEEPVLLQDVNLEYNENLLRNRMENLGFFNAYVTSDTIVKGKYADVHFNAFPGKVYRISKVDFEVDSQRIGQDIISAKENTLLKTGNNYNLDVILKERERIDDDLKNKGYYYFSPDNILVEVDSNRQNQKVDMYVTIKPETTDKALSPQRIGNIFVYPNYTGAGGRADRRLDSVSSPYIDGLHFIDPQNTYRKSILANHIFFKKGNLYTREDHNMTLRHLVNLNTFKFVKNNFVDSKDTANRLDVYYYLTPLPRKSLRFELLGKTASVYNGTEANINWTLRNAFKGFETLTLSVFGGYEAQTGGNIALNSNYIRYGAEIGISWPRLLSPYKWAPSLRFIPRTYAKAGYEFLNRRNAYTLNSLRLNYGYQWKENEQKEHDLALAEIIYVRPSNISDTYRAQMDTVPTLQHVVDRQFSFGPNYTYTFTNTMLESRKHTFYLKTGVNTSGNVLGLMQGADFKDGNIKRLFGTAYAQFLKAEIDFRHYMKFSPKSQLASRIMIGTSYSYGNSRSLPYLKQYFTGGPNGLRAFRARSIGPGSAVPQNLGSDNFFADQTGDYKLEINTEYRAPISGMFHWAAFVDAGNVWLQREDEDKLGGEISKNFYKELAVGAGLGLRLDLDFLLVRLDVATPLRVPYREQGDRWVFKYMEIRNSEWRKDNLIFNLAIGYPF